MLDNRTGYGEHLMVFDCEADLDQNFTDESLIDLEGSSDGAMPVPRTYYIVAISAACPVHIPASLGDDIHKESLSTRRKSSQSRPTLITQLY